LLVLLLEVCSLESLPGALLLELDDEWCSLLVDGSTTTGAGAATTIGGGGTTTGAGYTATGGASVVVWLELVVLLVWANPTAALPNSTAIPKDKAAVLNEFFTMTSPLVPMMIGSLQSKVVFSSTARTSQVLNAVLSAPENAIGHVVRLLRPIQSCRLAPAAHRLISRAYSSDFAGIFFEFFSEDCLCAASNISFSRAHQKSIVKAS
jgi:hypothetical protein